MTRALAAFRAVGYLLVLAFLGWQLWRVRHGLGDSFRSVGAGGTLAAGVLATLGLVPGFLGWRTLLAGLGGRPPWLGAARVFVLANATRYLPGGVWPTLAQAALARSVGQPPARLAAASLASLGLSTVTALVVGLLALPWLVAADPAWWLLPLGMVAAVLAGFLAPGPLRWLVAAAARVLGRREPVRLPTRRTALRASALMTAGWLVQGLHAAVLAAALGADLGAAVLLGIGGFALGVTAGLLSLMPNGVGGRELVLGLTFAALLSDSDLVAFVALSRVLMTAAELSLTAGVLAAHGWLRRRARRRSSTTTTATTTTATASPRPVPRTGAPSSPGRLVS